MRQASIPELKRARSLATDLRSLLEEIAADHHDAEDDDAQDLEEMANYAGTVEDWLDGLDLGD